MPARQRLQPGCYRCYLIVSVIVLCRLFVPAILPLHGLATFVPGATSSSMHVQRGQRVQCHAEEPQEVSRRNVLLENVTTPSPASAVLLALMTFIIYFLTREEKVRKSKICIRSKQFIDDFMADPKKTATLAEKGVPYESMRQYLQGDDCLEFSAWFEQAKSAKAFWELGEEYKVG
mmetsp:Transcript_22639/g.40923  ORF Transcript_22639/g.40923 Transcript_22639/m.40923 type:complete len:176 (+) Transcript_22639:74-601(+)